MKTIVSDTPAADAGQYITQKLQDHMSDDIIFIVSGGSSLAVLELVDVASLKILKTLTVATGDERYTTNTQASNFSQLQETSFYKTIKGSHTSFINSNVQKNEDFETFTKRLQISFNEYYQKHPEAYTIVLLGIGEDGHTASIFPDTEQKFNEQYMIDELYTGITNESLEYKCRTTITPGFIEEKVTDVVLFAAGSAKCDTICNYMYNKNFRPNQIPVLIAAQHPQSILFTDCQTSASQLNKKLHR